LLLGRESQAGPTHIISQGAHGIKGFARLLLLAQSRRHLLFLAGEYRVRPQA